MKPGTSTRSPLEIVQSTDAKIRREARRAAQRRFFETACSVYLSAWLCTNAYFFTDRGFSTWGILAECGVGLVGLVPLTFDPNIERRRKYKLVPLAGLIALSVAYLQWELDYGGLIQFNGSLGNVAAFLLSGQFLFVPFLLFSYLVGRTGRMRSWARIAWSIPFLLAPFFALRVTSGLAYDSQLPAFMVLASISGILASFLVIKQPVFTLRNTLTALLFALFMPIAWWSVVVGWLTWSLTSGLTTVTTG